MAWTCLQANFPFFDENSSIGHQDTVQILRLLWWELSRTPISWLCRFAHGLEIEWKFYYRNSMLLLSSTKFLYSRTIKRERTAYFYVLRMGHQLFHFWWNHWLFKHKNEIRRWARNCFKNSFRNTHENLVRLGSKRNRCFTHLDYNVKIRGKITSNPITTITFELNDCIFDSNIWILASNKK